MKQQFAMATGYQVVIGIFAIGGIVAAYLSEAVEFMGVGVSTGYWVSLLVLVAYSRRYGISYKPNIAFKGKGLKILCIMAIPMLISAAVEDVNSLVDRNMASTLPDGTISALSYSSRISGLLTSIIGMALVTVVFPRFSSLAATGNLDAVRSMLDSSFRVLFCVVLPLSIITLMLAGPFVRIILERGDFTKENSTMTAECLRMYALGLLPTNIAVLFTRVYYSLGVSLVPSIVSSLCVFVNVGLNFALIGSLQHQGIALATSLAMVGNVVLSGFLLKRYVGNVLGPGTKVELAKVLVAAIVMSAILWIGENRMLLTDGSLVYCILGTSVLVVGSVLVFIIGLMITRSNIGAFVYNALKRDNVHGR
jgi:putative peptidoglycan lipid II flippase